MRTVRPKGFALLALGAAASLSISACGIRVSRSDVIAAAGGGPVSITSADSPASGSTGGTGSDGSTGIASPGGATGASTTGGSLGATGATTPTTTTGSLVTSGRAGTTSTSGPVAGPTSGPAAGPTSGPVAGPDTSCSKPGAPIVFGQVGTFSGVIGASQGSATTGLKAWAAATNAAGGIACHPVVVKSIDDGGSSGNAQSAVQTLIENDHAVAINAFVPVTLNGIQTTVNNAKVPVVGGDGLADAWVTDPNFYLAGTSFESVLYGFAKYSAMRGGTKYSMFYCIEATPCTAAQDYFTKKGGGKKAGLTPVGDQPISLAQSSFVQQCSTAKRNGADVVLIGAGSTAASAIGRDCASQDYHPIYATLALAAVNSLQTDPNLASLAISLTAFPWMLDSTPAQAAFQSAIRKYAPSAEIGGAATVAWTSGELLKAAILNLGEAAYGTITPGMVTQGLRMIKGNDLGGLVPGKLDFSRGGNTSPVRCSFIAAIINGRWGAPIGNSTICEP